MFRSFNTCFQLFLRKPTKNFKYCSYCTSSSDDKISNFKEKLSTGPSFPSFVGKSSIENNIQSEYPPYISSDPASNSKRKVYIETYGCQMNVNDTEIIYAILKKEGYEILTSLDDANTVLVMTCSIREGAEQKIFNRLNYLKRVKHKHDRKSQNPMKIGVLGCMAERLKRRLLEKEKVVDIIAGPDSYKDLPNLLSQADEGQKAVNIILSADETYADIMPVRINSSSKSAFVSIMRGCDNFCAFCVVPQTRGRERSRPISSILDEVRHLSDQGVKEVTLLGQNVNSYRDVSVPLNTQTVLSSGFKTEYRNRIGGMRFADLLDKVSDINPEMRIRFTSPHPKDFPDDVLHVINEKPNVCKLIHLPAQSGNSAVLETMKRGYTREAYLELVDHIRDTIPGVAFTSDFICGFCEESEEAHKDTLSLLEQVKYEFAYIFPYSMREKTIAHGKYKDNVPEDVKKRRADEAYAVFREKAMERHLKEIGSQHLVQVIGPSKRSEADWSGRNDWNTKVIYPQVPIPADNYSADQRLPLPGDYIVVQITSCSSQVLKGIPLYHTSLQKFYSDLRQNVAFA